jgi:hypothetical protein
MISSPVTLTFYSRESAKGEMAEGMALFSGVFVPTGRK